MLLLNHYRWVFGLSYATKLPLPFLEASSSTSRVVDMASQVRMLLQIWYHMYYIGSLGVPQVNVHLDLDLIYKISFSIARHPLFITMYCLWTYHDLPLVSAASFRSALAIWHHNMTLHSSRSTTCQLTNWEHNFDPNQNPKHQGM